MIYHYSFIIAKGYELETAKGKDAQVNLEWSQGQSFHPPKGQITLAAPLYDSALRVLPAKEAHPSYCRQSFHWGLICKHD